MVKWSNDKQMKTVMRKSLNLGVANPWVCTKKQRKFAKEYDEF